MPTFPIDPFTLQPTDVNPTTPGGVGVPGQAGSMASYDPFNAPMWGGPYSAPLLGSQLDALQGFQNLVRQQPMLQTMDIRRMIDNALTGGNAYLPGQNLNSLIQPFQLNQESLGLFREGAQDGFYGGPVPQGSDLSGIQQQINSFLGRQIPLSDLGGFNQSLQAALSATTGQGGMQALFEQMNRVLGDRPQTNMQGPANTLADASTFRGFGGFDGMDGILRTIAGGSGLDGPNMGRTNETLDMLSGGLRTALGAPRFDQTEMFSNMEQIFRDDLEKELANVKEEFTGLGLGAGSSDRTGALSREAGTALARFRLGQQQLAQDAFESAEQRRLGALGAGQGIGSLALNAAMAPADFGLRRAGVQAGAADTLMGRHLDAFDANLAARGQNIDAATRLADVLQAPTQEALAARGQDIAGIGQMLDATLQGQSIGGSNAANLLSLMFEGAQLPFEQQLSLMDAQGQFLPLAMEAATQPFREQLALADTIYNPAADRALASASQIRGIEDSAFDRFFQTQDAAANRQLAAMPYLLEMEQRPFDRMLQQFQLGEQARSVADQDIMRQMAEFARTQGMGFEQMIQLINAIEPISTGFGPSTLSQFGDIIGAIATAVGAAA